MKKYLTAIPPRSILGLRNMRKNSSASMDIPVPSMMTISRVLIRGKPIRRSFVAGRKTFGAKSAATTTAKTKNMRNLFTKLPICSINRIMIFYITL